MEIILHCVGRLDREWAVLFDEYAVRIRHFSQLKVLEVAEPKGRFKNPSEPVQRYSAELAAQIGRDPYFIFDRTGPELASPEFADWLGGRLEAPPHRVRLVIGGSDGLDGRIVAGAARMRQATAGFLEAVSAGDAVRVRRDLTEQSLAEPILFAKPRVFGYTPEWHSLPQ